MESIFKKTINYLNKNNSKNYTDKSEIINEYIPQDEIKNLIQEDLPFIKAEKIKETEKIKCIPGLDLLTSIFKASTPEMLTKMKPTTLSFLKKFY